MNNLEHFEKNIQEIESRIGYKFINTILLKEAFTHRSFYNENRDKITQHNERLEFLGDAVLGAIISKFLYTTLQQEGEGSLSHLRSQMVDSTACACYLQKWGFESFVLLGKGERINDGRGRESIYADLFEAILGAIFLEAGYNEAEKIFLFHFKEELTQTVLSPSRNAKAELQGYTQKMFQMTPRYEVLEETGPDHSKIFRVAVYIDKDLLGKGEGSSKKIAEQKAAFDALQQLEERQNGQS